MIDHHPCAQLYSVARHYIQLAEKHPTNTTHCLTGLVFTAFSGEAFLNDHLFELWQQKGPRQKLVGVAIKDWGELERKPVMKKYEMLVSFYRSPNQSEEAALKSLFDLRNMPAHPKVKTAKLVEGPVLTFEDPFTQAFKYEIVRSHFEELDSFMTRLDTLGGRVIPTNRLVGS